MKNLIVLLIIILCMLKFSEAQMMYSGNPQKEIHFIFEKSTKSNEELKSNFISSLKSSSKFDKEDFKGEFSSDSLLLRISNIIPEYYGEIMNATHFNITEFSYDLICKIKDNTINFKCINFKTTYPVCIKNNIPCNCISKDDSLKLIKIGEERQQFVNTFDPIFQIIYDKEIGADYEKKDISLKSLFDGKRNLENELSVIKKYLSENKIKFFSYSEFAALMKNNYSKTYLLNYNGGLGDDVIKLKDNNINISKDVWNKIFLYSEATRYADFAKSIGSKLICVKDNNGIKDKYDKVIINIKDKLIPVNIKERKQYYKDNNVTKEEQKEIEILFEQEISK